MKTLLCFIIVSLSLLCSCSSPEKKEIAPKTRVAISLPPYAYFIQKIAGESVHIVPLVPKECNPHLFEPTPKQVEEILKTDLWIRSHEYFEEKILTALGNRHPDLAVVDLAATLPEEDEDRHIWLSPKLAIDQVMTITEALCKLLPENEALYKSNSALFIEELKELDLDMQTKLAPLQNRAILTSHPAFGQLCKSYGLIQLSIECEGKDPLPQNLERTLALAKAHKVASILLQPQYNNRGAQLIAEQLDLPTFSIDPYASDYMNNLKRICQLLVDDHPTE